MKHVLSQNKIVKVAVIAMLAIQTCVAQQVFAESKDSDSATKWIQSKLDGRKGMDLLGQTPDGKPCGLYLTDIYQGLYGYYVVVGLQGTQDSNDYIGLATKSKAKIKVSDQELFFHVDDSWGNDSWRNTVTVKLGANGSLMSAIGVSDLKTITCNLSGETKGR
jgi:hypothetical protein